MATNTDRRHFLAKSLLGTAGVRRRASVLKEKILLAAVQDGTAESDETKKPKTDIPPGSLPCGKIRNVSISRLIIGSNLIAGYAHSRDLIYVSSLFQAYNTEAKVIETLELAQACGINTILCNTDVLIPVLKYTRRVRTKSRPWSASGLKMTKAR